MLIRIKQNKIKKYNGYLCSSDVNSDLNARHMYIVYTIKAHTLYTREAHIYIYTL